MLFNFCISATLLCAAAFAQAPLDPTSQPPNNQSSNPNATSPYPSSSTNPNSTGNSQTTGSSMRPDPAITERAFLRRVAERSLTLGELGKLAQEKASSDRVKRFGKQLAADAERTRRNLAPAAGLLKMNVPSEVSKGGRKTLDRMAKLSGPEFDHAFVKLVVNARKADIPAFNDMSQTGSAPEIQNFAARALPALERQLKTAGEIAAGTKQ